MKIIIEKLLLGIGVTSVPTLIRQLHTKQIQIL